MTQCDSSLIAAFSYDDTAEMLTVVFRSTNEVRHYTGFPPELFWEFEETESKGKFFNSKIKHQFEVLKSGKVSDEQLANAVSASPSVPVIDASVKVVAPDLGITDEDIRATDSEYAPVSDENLLPEEEEALAEPAKKKTAVDKVLSQWNQLVPAQRVGLKIVDKAQYTQVAETLKKKVGIRDLVFSLLDPTRDIVYKAYKAVQDRQKGIIDPMDASIKGDKTALLAYDTEQQRIAQEKQRQAQREAEEAQERERRRQTEELRLRVAQEQAEAGDIEGAEASLFDESVQAPVMPVYVPRVEAETPAVSGLSGRKNWKVDEASIDIEELILDAAEGIKSVRAGKGLLGHAPTNVFKPNIPTLNTLAKGNERIDLYPGVKSFNDAVLSIRR